MPRNKLMVAPGLSTANVLTKKCLAAAKHFSAKYPNLETSSGYVELV
jgi:hypothetical protein